MFLEVLAELYGVAANLFEGFSVISGESQKQGISSQVRSGVTRVTQGADIWAVYESARAYRKDLVSVSRIVRDGHDVVDYFISEVDSFLQRYQQYLAGRDYATAFDLVLVAYELYPRIQGVALVADLAEKNLRLDPFESSESDLVIESDSVLVGLADFIAIIESIDGVYREVARIIEGASHSELEIIKIEAGSFYAKLRGAAKVVPIVSGILRRAAHYGIRHHSLSGRIDRLPKSAEAIEGILRVRDALSKSGVDVSGMDGELSEASVKLARHANVLMGQLNEIGVNGEFFSVVEDVRAALPAPEPKLLGHEGSNDEQ